LFRRINARHLSEDGFCVGDFAQHRAQWSGDVARRQAAGGDLVQQRLKQVEIAAIDDGDVTFDVFEAKHAVDAREAASDHDDTMLCVVAVHGYRYAMPERVCIDRCVCFDKKFVVLQQIATARNVRTLVDLQEEAGFGLACRMCHPYVRRMLRTGETVFHVIVQDGDEP
jgi:hypothetical protein